MEVIFDYMSEIVTALMNTVMHSVYQHLKF